MAHGPTGWHPITLKASKAACVCTGIPGSAFARSAIVDPLLPPVVAAGAGGVASTVKRNAFSCFS